MRHKFSSLSFVSLDRFWPTVVRTVEKSQEASIQDSHCDAKRLGHQRKTLSVFQYDVGEAATRVLLIRNHLNLSDNDVKQFINTARDLSRAG